MPVDPVTFESLEAFKAATNSALLEAQNSAEELKDLIEAAEKAMVIVHLDLDLDPHSCSCSTRLHIECPRKSSEKPLSRPPNWNTIPAGSKRAVSANI